MRFGVRLLQILRLYFGTLIHSCYSKRSAPALGQIWIGAVGQYWVGANRQDIYRVSEALVEQFIASFSTSITPKMRATASSRWRSITTTMVRPATCR